MSHKIAGRLWESVGTDIFTINYKHYIIIVDYHSRLPVVNQLQGFSTDNWIKMQDCISEYKLPSKIVSDAGTKYISEKFENFCRHTSCSIFIIQPWKQWTSKIYIQFYRELWNSAMKLMLIYMSLLQIRWTLISLGLPSSPTLLFNKLSRDILLRFSRLPTGWDNDESNHSALIKRQLKQMKMLIFTKYPFLSIFFYLLSFPIMKKVTDSFKWFRETDWMDHGSCI